MTKKLFTIEDLGKQDLSGFSCGVDVLDKYFHRQASQDVRRRVAGCNVLIEISSGRAAGFYTLSACHINLDALSDKLQKKLPRYPNVPAVRLGRLAVDINFHGQGLGSVLIFDAVNRSINSDVVAHMMVVDAKDEKAARFYTHHGFVQDISEPLRLFAPLDHLSKSLSG